MTTIKEDYTRVTTILSPFTGYGAIDPVVLQNAADRGTAVHKIIEEILAGTYFGLIPGEFRGYVDSFNKFWGERLFDIVQMEHRMYNDQYMITGQCDVIVRDREDGRLLLLDWKTSYSINKTWDMQGAAYQYMARESGQAVDEVIFIKLDKKGAMPKIVHSNGTFDEFLDVYNIYNKYFKNQKTPELFEE